MIKKKNFFFPLKPIIVHKRYIVALLISKRDVIRSGARLTNYVGQT